MCHTYPNRTNTFAVEMMIVQLTLKPVTPSPMSSIYSNVHSLTPKPEEAAERPALWAMVGGSFWPKMGQEVAVLAVSILSVIPSPCADTSLPRQALCKRVGPWAFVDAGCGRRMTTVHSLCGVLIGSNSRNGWRSKRYCLASTVVERSCMMANAKYFVEMIGRHTCTHALTSKGAP